MRFDVMGTWAHLVVVGGPPGAEEWARERLLELERRWSRFLPDSEISRMNLAPGRPTLVSPETAGLMARAQWACRATAGRFDPSILPALVAAGYVAADPAAPTSGFDPGGIGKGYAADLVTEELRAAGATGACVNVGGDLRADGTPPDATAWIVDVENPFDPTATPLLRLGLDRGAIATSSRLRRAWAGGHHLIDPSTGQPSTSDAVAATVIAGTAWRAEALATAAVIAGVAEGLELIESLGATGLLVGADAGVHHAPGLEPFLE
ncbi:MAG TPA: FAD:protein FMN transferase [Acidimicrobiales bacterium]|nr:FAD:protein FMN transferase [Acidimicrobiales bacterium]